MHVIIRPGCKMFSTIHHPCSCYVLSAWSRPRCFQESKLWNALYRELPEGHQATLDTWHDLFKGATKDLSTAVENMYRFQWHALTCALEYWLDCREHGRFQERTLSTLKRGLYAHSLSLQSISRLIFHLHTRYDVIARCGRGKIAWRLGGYDM